METTFWASNVLSLPRVFFGKYILRYLSNDWRIEILIIIPGWVGTPPGFDKIKPHQITFLPLELWLELPWPALSDGHGAPLYGLLNWRALQSLEG